MSKTRTCRHGLMCSLCGLLLSCGDGGDSTGDVASGSVSLDNPSSDSLTPDAPAPDRDPAAGAFGEGSTSPLRGVFVDSPVSGLIHISASGTGVTDSEGRFTYRSNERVEFLLGDVNRPGPGGWSLGGALGAPVVTPLDLSGADRLTAPVINTVRLLQSLDVDRDPSNGIALPPLPSDLLDATLSPDFSLPTDDFFDDPSVRALLERTTGTGRPTDLGRSLDHFHTSLNDVLDPPSGDWILTEAVHAGGTLSGMQASLSFQSAQTFEAIVRSGDDRGHVTARYRLEGQALTVTPTRADVVVDDGTDSRADLDGEALETLLSSAHPAMRLALGLNARLRHLPGSIELHDAGGGIRLTYHRGDPLVNEIASYAEISSIDPPTLAIGGTGALRVEAFTSSSSVVSGARFTWRSSDESVATVTPDGVVLAVGAGFATITARSSGMEAELRIEVVATSPDVPPVSCRDQSTTQVNLSQINQSNSDPPEDGLSHTSVESVVQIDDSRCDTHPKNTMPD